MHRLGLYDGFPVLTLNGGEFGFHRLWANGTYHPPTRTKTPAEQPPLPLMSGVPTYFSLPNYSTLQVHSEASDYHYQHFATRPLRLPPSGLLGSASCCSDCLSSHSTGSHHPHHGLKVSLLGNQARMPLDLRRGRVRPVLRPGLHRQPRDPGDDLPPLGRRTYFRSRGSYTHEPKAMAPFPSRTAF